MTENECAIAVAAWAEDTLPELAAAVPYLSAQKGDLPDVQVDASEKQLRITDQRFPILSAIQNVVLRVFEVDLAFMVESDPSGGDKEETEQLRDFGARLEASILEDSSLGSRVHQASPLVAFNYRLPFVQYADNTRGRQMTMALAVAEPIQQGGVL